MRHAARVTLALTGVTAVALAASFVAVSFLVKRDETRDLDRALLLQAHASAERALFEDPLHPALRESAAQVPEHLSSIPSYVVIYDGAGRPVYTSRSFQEPAPRLDGLGVVRPIPAEGTAVDFSVDGSRLRGVVIPMDDHDHELLFATSRETIDEDVRFLRRIGTVLFVALMGLTLLVARWLSARLSREMETLASVARLVAEGDLDARVGKRAQGTKETRMLATDMDRMIDQLSTLLRSQRRFISHAAHELRSPLATIRGELQLALRRPREAAEYRAAIEETLADVESLVTLAEDLLALARIQTVQPAAPEPVRLDDLVAETLRSVRGLAKDRSIVVDVTYASGDEGTLVPGPLGEVSRALRNLVENAIAHTADAGVVSVSTASLDDGVAVRVVDRGPGVAFEDREHVFQPFYRGSKEQGSERPGAGLGLAIAREIARARGGDVLLDETTTSGCCFELHLPQVAVAGADSLPPS